MILLSKFDPVHHISIMDLQDNLRSWRLPQALWAHNLWVLSCAGFRHLAGFHARVILDVAACRLGELGDVHDVMGVLGGDHVVTVVLRVLVIGSAASNLVLRYLSPGGERVQTGHPLTIHICAVQFVHKRGTHTTRLAQGPTRLKSSRIAFHLCAPEKNLSSGVAHVSSSSVDSPAVHHEHLIFLIHSSFNPMQEQLKPLLQWCLASYAAGYSAGKLV